MNCTNFNHTLFLAIKKELEDYLGYFGVSNNFIILIFLVILVMSCITNITLVADQSDLTAPRRVDVETPVGLNRYDAPPSYQYVARQYQQPTNNNESSSEATLTAANRQSP